MCCVGFCYGRFIGWNAPHPLVHDLWYFRRASAFDSYQKKTIRAQGDYQEAADHRKGASWRQDRVGSCQTMAVSMAAYLRRKDQCSHVKKGDLKRLREPQKENARLKESGGWTDSQHYHLKGICRQTILGSARKKRRLDYTENGP